MRFRPAPAPGVLGAAGVFFAVVTALQGQPNAAADQIRTLSNEVLRLDGQMRQTHDGTTVELRTRAAEAIRRRAAEFGTIIAQDPVRALSLALSPELIADLAHRYPEAAESLETHGTWEGTVENWVADYHDGHYRRLTRMRVGDESLELHFAGPEPASCGNGASLRATGVRVGNQVAVSSSEIDPPAAKATTHITTTGACSNTGVQNIVVLMATFPGVTPPSTVTPQSVHDIFFGTTGHSLDGYWREASYGKTSAAGNVYGWYTLSQAYSCSTIDQALTEAMGIAAATGASFPNGTRVFLIYPKIGCVSGFAEVGCGTLGTPSGTINASTSYIEADYMDGDEGVYFAIHEAGHNLGLQHAGTLSYGTETLGPLTSTGTVSEFGDDFSAMGSQTLGQYSAQHKAEILGWLASGANYQVIQSSGSWTLQPFETSSAGLQALKIQRGTGNNDWLWVEYRQPIGTYDSTLYFQQPSGGAFIHYEDPTVGAFTHLLNFAPQTGSWYAPALLAGQTWTDPYTNLSITIQSATPSAMTVNVTYGPMPCTPVNPTVSLSPANPSTAPGNSVGYTLTLTDNDSAGCPANTYTLGSTQPNGWATAFSSPTLTLSPGQSGSAKMTKTVPASAPAGVYVVDSSATAGTEAESGSANVTVTAPSLAVAVSIASSTYGVGQTVPLNATVSYGGNAAAGASVTFTVTDPNGARSTKSVTASSTGTATWNYKIGPKGPRGSYSVTSRATYSSQTASGTASFTVQ